MSSLAGKAPVPSSPKASSPKFNGPLVLWIVLGLIALGILIFAVRLSSSSSAMEVPLPTPTVEAITMEEPASQNPPPTEEPASQNPPPTEEPVITAYVVVAGDYFSTIADKFGVSVSALAQANPQITDINTIMPGQVITIPVVGDATARGAAEVPMTWEDVISFPSLASVPVPFEGGFYFFPSGNTEGTVKIPANGGGFVATGSAVVTNVTDGISNTYTTAEDTGYIIQLHPGKEYLIKTLVSSSIQVYYSISTEKLGEETQVAIATMFDPSSGNCGDGCLIVLERQGVVNGNKVHYQAPVGVEAASMKDVILRFDADNDVFVVPENDPRTHGIIFECVTACTVNGVSQPAGYVSVRPAVPTDMRLETDESYIVKISGTVRVTWYYNGLPQGY